MKFYSGQGAVHPANRLLIWSAWAIHIAKLTLIPLLIMTMGSAAMALYLSPQSVTYSLRRIRWLVLVSILVFAWNTPGVYIFSSWYAPSIEGIYKGVGHALYLIATVTSLQIALYQLDHKKILSACYVLTYPLQWIRIDNARLAIRLGLTLRYAEQWLSSRSYVSWPFMKRRLLQLFKDDALLNAQHLSDEHSIEIVEYMAKDKQTFVGIILLSIIINWLCRFFI